MQLRQVLESEPMIARAISVAEALAQDKHEMMIAQYREDAIRDETWRRLTAIDEGISLGRAEGISLGEARGISLGERRARVDVVRRLAQAEMPLSQISSFAGIPEQEVREILASA